MDCHESTNKLPNNNPVGIDLAIDSIASPAHAHLNLYLPNSTFKHGNLLHSLVARLKRPTVHLILLLIAFPADAQPVRFQHITVDDGLSQDIVTAIVQDEEGFMWFGTEDGLNRYDGNAVTVYKHNPNDSTTLVSNSISALFADHRGRVWVSTAAGVDIFDISEQTFHHVKELGRNTSATGFHQGADSAIWIGTNNGLFMYAEGSFRPAALDGRLLTHAIWGQKTDGDRIWFIDTAGLHWCAMENERLHSVALPRALRVLNGSVVSEVMRDRHKQLWVSTDNGVFRFDSALTTYKHYTGKAGRSSALLDKSVRNGIEDQEGILWFGTMSGLEKYEPSFDTFTHFQSEPGNPSGFLGNRVYAFYVDRTGMLWIGTYRGGINMYSPVREKFRLFTPPAYTNAHDIYVINEAPNGQLLVGTDNGLYLVGNSPNSPWTPYARFAGKSIFSICRLRNGEIWIGTTGSVTPLGETPKNFETIALPVNDPVRLIFQDNDGQIWVGCDAYGLYTIDRLARKAVRWSPPDKPFSGGAWSMFRDGAQQLWIGTWNSDYSFRYDKAHGIAVRYGAGAFADVALASPSIRVFREDSAGTLWLGTWGGGIYRLDAAYKPVRQLTELDGLASDFVKSMEIDHAGEFWIGTERGLSSFDPRTETFKTYTQRDGLPSNFFFSGSSFKHRNGMLYFGGQKGFAGFNPDSIPLNDAPPPVVITAFRILDEPVPPRKWSPRNGPITLRYDQDFFSFEYVALDFTAPRRNQYAYKLEGFDRGWIQAGTRRYAAYTHLDPGTYRFHVKASNNDGVWNNVGATMTVIITPAFWMTWWFRISLMATIILSLYLSYQYRLKKMLEVERLRQRIARDLHDDIGTNLSAIVLASQMTSRESIPPALHEYVEDIRSIAIETQDHMRDIVWMLNPRNDSLELLVSRMRDDAARLLRELSYSFKASQELSAKIDLTLKRNVFLIYKEALHNIVKHSRARNVEIRIEARGKMFEFYVQDDGRGFDVTRSVPGNGLDNMNARAEQMGAALHIQSTPGAGTKIHLETKIA